jgi:hypothetical protein
LGRNERCREYVRRINPKKGGIMAKLKYELELDWVDEEYTLDESIKEQIEKKIEASIVNKMLKVIQDKTEAKITEQIESMVMTAISDRIESFLTTPRNITDSYGDVIKENVTVDSILKEKLETALTKKTLGEDGKFCSYGAKFSLFEFIATKNLNKMVIKSVENATKNTKKEIEEMVASALKGRIAENLTDMILKNSSVLGITKKGE